MGTSICGENDCDKSGADTVEKNPALADAREATDRAQTTKFIEGYQSPGRQSVGLSAVFFVLPRVSVLKSARAPRRSKMKSKTPRKNP